MLGTGEPSPIMKRSPSMRLLKENITGDKLFSTIDLSAIGRTRRNSIPSLHGRTESRGSVPIVIFGSQRLVGARGSITSSQQNSKYRSLKSYLRGFGDQANSAGVNDLSKLDDMLAQIRYQLVSKKIIIIINFLLVLSAIIITDNYNNNYNYNRLYTNALHVYSSKVDD